MFRIVIPSSDTVLREFDSTCSLDYAKARAYEFIASNGWRPSYISIQKRAREKFKWIETTKEQSTGVVIVDGSGGRMGLDTFIWTGKIEDRWTKCIEHAAVFHSQAAAIRELQEKAIQDKDIIIGTPVIVYVKQEHICEEIWEDI
jgi:hypothetical protein